MDTTTQIELLRRYEPVLRFTRGEAFFPWDVSEYIKECSLWVVEPDREPVCLIPEGELNLEMLGSIPKENNSRGLYYLQFVSLPNIRELAIYQLKKSIRKKTPDEKFHAGSGRLARVGYLSRLIDALFSISLFARGRVPGDAALSAAEIYRRCIEKNSIYRYYGRVVWNHPWLVLQYWFFYPFNNWRSGFFGLNDHEADWEQVAIYLYEDGGEFYPEWIAYAMHDFKGDDLRRRWDDPELHKVGEHPVIYVGAGSHASYFRPGEYLTEIPLKFLNSVWLPYVRIKSIVSRFLQRDHMDVDGGEQTNMIVIPFVDYARGDGKSLGYGQSHVWDNPILLDSNEGWVEGYPGLWGLYARDPVSGENAPAGPSYNQDGTIRLAWHHPVGWAGLDKILPPPNEIVAVQGRIRKLENEISHLDRDIDEKQEILVNRRIDFDATHLSPDLSRYYEQGDGSLHDLTSELITLKTRRVELQILMAALYDYVRRFEAGEKTPPQAHIRRIIRPDDPALKKANRIAEAWAALSVGLLLVSLILILIFARQSLILGLAAVMSGFLFIEAIFRGRINQLIVHFSTVMAVIALFILVFEFLDILLIGFVLIIGGYIMWENLRELWV
jgi:hypothetical protein